MRVTANRRLNVAPSWSPDGRSIAYTSFIAHPAADHGVERLSGDARNADRREIGRVFPVFSPDGSRIAFMSQRDGNSEIYVMNRNGSGVRRLTNNYGDRIGADVVADRYADRVYVGPIGFGADLGDGCRRLEPAAAHVRRVMGRQAPRGRRRRSTRSPMRRNPVPATTSEFTMSPPARRAHHRRRRHQRKPGIFAQRPAHRIHLVTARQDAHFHDGARRQGPAADHARRQQHIPELVELNARQRPR